MERYKNITIEELANNISTLLCDQFRDIMEALRSPEVFTFSIIPEIYENNFGGNPTLKTRVNFQIRGHVFPEWEATYNPASGTARGHLNEVKAHLLDIIDSVTALF